MPGITVHLDEKLIATINLARLEVFHVTAHGALDQDPKASLDAMGGQYSDKAASGFWIWITELELRSEQMVEVFFVDQCGDGESGKTVDELCPDKEESNQTDFRITPELAEEIRARPQLHEDFTVLVHTSQGQRAVATSSERNTSFRFSVGWNWTEPDKARVSLGTYCLDDVIARRSGAEHLETKLSFGDSATFTLMPANK
ncbi:MAG TPA: hypothetical protein VGC21_17815 [Telluria sp.]